MPSQPAEAIAALTGNLRKHHRFLSRELLRLIEAQDLSITHLEQEIERRISPFEEKIQRGEQITGVSRQMVHVLMVEVGTDLARFPDAEHLNSWAGVCPGHQESAGKRLSERSKHGNRYCESDAGTSSPLCSSLSQLLGRALSSSKKKRRGNKRAALAIGHDILVISYQMMKTGEEYHEKGEMFFPRMDRDKVERRLVQHLKRMGYQVTRPPQPVA